MGILLALLALACRKEDDRPAPAGSSSAPVARSERHAPSAAPALLLYLPDGGDVALSPGERPTLPLLPGPGTSAGRCPADMVDVRGRFCIDRYEAALVDAQGRQFSPYYPVNFSEAQQNLARFRSLTPVMASPPPLPLIPDWQKSSSALAQSRPGIVPNGYTSGLAARDACASAGKRLCSAAEWEMACRGEQDRAFPYGDTYQPERCNVFRDAHPASALHGDASRNHHDPRLNLVSGPSGPLLRKTGATPECRSTWGQDAVYDMVGNLDEWIDDPEGTFAGGFFSRNTREGCAARVSSHSIEYYDYSLGVRCCR